MGLAEQLEEDLKQAMRDRDAIRRGAIRLIRTAIQNQEISTRASLSEEDIIQLLAREVRQRRESIDEYRKANRTDLLEKEEAELAIVMGYMPQQLSRDEIAAEARKAIEETGARGPAEKGKVMGKLAPAMRGKADGRLINEIVTELLEG